MNKYILYTFLAVACVTTPIVVQAQTTNAFSHIQYLQSIVTNLQEQIASRFQTNQQNTYYGPAYGPSAGVQTFCPVFTTDLQQGNRDTYSNGSVAQLQQFLYTQGVYPEGLVTGYFGPATQQAVQRFQQQRGVSYGGAGYGRVGPRTRSAIQSVCGGSVYGNQYSNNYYNTPQYPYPPLYQPYPNNSCPQIQLIPCLGGVRIPLGADAKGCSLGYACKPLTSYSDHIPVITEFSGPTVLAEDTEGVWTIKARDEDSDYLRYSVRWGDEAPDYLARGVSGISFTQTATLRHVYANPGTYTIRITVTDDTNQSTSATATILVTRSGPSACTAQYAPVCGVQSVQCITYPCSQVQQTFSNICELNRAGASYLHQGACVGSYY